jgi:hypothetical protein
MNRFFPFYALGFACNPFRALTDEEWVEAAVVPSQVQGVIDSGFVNLQILGERGYGKTTMLLFLAAQQRYAGKRVVYERISEDGCAFGTAVSGLDCFVLDEAQRLEKKERIRLLDQSQSVQLILASHDDLGRVFSACKRPIRTVDLGQSGPEHLRAVLNRRLRYFSLKDRLPEPLSEELIDFLWRKFGRNIRAVEQYLYEYFQGMVKEGEK